MLVVDYEGVDYKGRKTEGTHKVSDYVHRKDDQAIVRDIKKRNTLLRTVTVTSKRGDQ